MRRMATITIGERDERGYSGEPGESEVNLRIGVFEGAYVGRKPRGCMHDQTNS